MSRRKSALAAAAYVDLSDPPVVGSPSRRLRTRTDYDASAREKLLLIRRYRGMTAELKEAFIDITNNWSVDFPGTTPAPWRPCTWFGLNQFIPTGTGPRDMVGDQIYMLNMQIGGHVILNNSNAQTTPIGFRWALVYYSGTCRVQPADFSYPVWPRPWSFVNAPGTFVLAEDSGYIINHFANNPSFFTFYQATNERGYGCYEWPHDVVPVHRRFKRGATLESGQGQVILWFWRDPNVVLGDLDATYTHKLCVRILYRDY